MAFDTETTTFFEVGGEWVTQDYSADPDIYSTANKTALVYIWQLAINDDVIYGREISDFVVFWERFCCINPYTSIVYVHNLGYDFEFLTEYLPSDIEVFAKAAYKPMYVRIKSLSLELRCSYMLTNMSLDKCSKQFGLSVKKAAGTMAYNVARTPITPLTTTELNYCEQDVRTITALIQEVFLKRYKNVADIPLTQTGEVRRYVKDRLKRVKYHLKDMDKIKPDLEMYKILTRVIQGGYTHLNFLYHGVKLDNVKSFDKSSSYPDVMCTRKYPSTKFRECSDYVRGDNNYSYLLYIRAEKIRANGYFAYIARHKVSKCLDGKTDNGKLHYATSFEMWVTDIDYDIICDTYRIEDGGKIEIIKCYKAFKKYLPRELILTILEQYNAKTTLKDVPEKADLYMREKQKLNSNFGMMCTSSIRDDVIYNGFSHAWENPEPMGDDEISAQLAADRPFLNYAWGVWVTAYARDDIIRVLNEIGADAVYSDTDSAKILNADNYRHIFDNFNAQCDKRIERVCNALDLDIDMFYPRDIYGKIHPMGHFECDGQYDVFLSLGSKKYCYIKGGKFSAVVAGLKKSYIDDSGEHSTLNDINQFFIGSKIPNARTVYWRLDNLQSVIIYDYLGNAYQTNNKQGLALINTNYTFSISNDYRDFVLDVRNKYTNYFRFTDRG